MVIVVKNPPANAGDAGKRCRFDPWVGKISWWKAWQPIPVFFAWRIQWTEEPGRLQTIGWQRVGHKRKDISSKLDFRNIKISYFQLDIKR